MISDIRRRIGVRAVALTAGLAVAGAGLVAAPASAASVGYDKAAEAAVLASTNKLRAGLGLSKLKVDPALAKVARAWAKHMADTGVQVHNPKKDSQIPQMPRWSAENIANSDAGAAGLFAQWKKSTDHYNNMTKADANSIGIGVYVNPDGRSWGTQVFANYIPVQAGSVKVGGTVKVGKTLSVKGTTWGPQGYAISLSYRWLRDGKAIAGATRTTYKLKAADAGHAIAVKVTGKAQAFRTVSKTSKAVDVPAARMTAPVPTISGTAKVGSKLVAKPGTWKPTGVKLTYQWYRSGKAMAGVTSSTYTPKAADAGRTIRVAVTGTKVGYYTTTRVSAAVRPLPLVTK